MSIASEVYIVCSSANPHSPDCTLKVSEHDLLWKPPAAHSDEHPRPQKKVVSCIRVLPLQIEGISGLALNWWSVRTAKGNL